MFERFLFYGLIGWAMEITWTGLHAFVHKDFRLVGTTSLWMFPIYGMAVFLEPLFRLLFYAPIVLRGGIYMICIFIGEFATGWYLRRLVGVCPWDYSSAKFNIAGLIRLDYAPVWFAVGLFYEKLYQFFLRLPVF